MLWLLHLNYQSINLILLLMIFFLLLLYILIDLAYFSFDWPWRCACTLPWLWNLWLDRRGRLFNPFNIVGPAALPVRLPGAAPAASWLSLHACSGSWAVSVWADSEPSPQDPRTSPSFERRRGRPAGWTWSPGTNLPTASRQPDAKRSATLAGPSLLRARARLKRGAGPQWGNPGRRSGAGGLIT